MAEGIKVGIGFATGRKSFKNVLRTYMYNLKESELTEIDRIRLRLFVAYDLNYENAEPEDFIHIDTDIMEEIDHACFIGEEETRKEMEDLVLRGIISEKEGGLLFGDGYASKRNIVVYEALKNGIDYLIFLDDDEYPVAVTKSRKYAVWGGQQVLRTHLEHIREADITNGYHCGYISPIPFIAFNEDLNEQDLRTFIEALSNDIVNWNTIKSVMENGGVTYADTSILISDEAEEVEEVNRAKFISGSNLTLNLTDPSRVLPFYNPPNARGEDTFLSTCLGERKVLRVPAYTFHDGFGAYQHLLLGVLPTNLNYIKADTKQVVERFYKACVGWIRYKPLYLYITQPETYEEKIEKVRARLEATLPKICRYFGRSDFMDVLREFEHYHSQVKQHYSDFLATQEAWGKITAYIAEQSESKTAI
ncbi:hypothetical protein BpJC7_09510 [Weizmannia acidilactici]|uniref:Uncharacterized protein n=1 Tax=Weizmannia acidilactici TaxID=2607726 RepID=A0A5J4JH13_9BACI|nr:hypothetical protein [Weizmannia acidilactici]GER67138.1 hypothetical protein BpJC4_16090 [Weizmannia acidilactici]GER69648.1 hypothetical protein BpJC7_09510 [Weizmannia acidilactici]GER72531.1 hypothetical protein BpPP18_05980 [Weizmannia acidilactici]